MKLMELDAQEISTGYYNPAEDNASTAHVDDTRKPVLTLKHINRLKKMRALKQLEALKRQDLLGIMYGIPDEPAGGGGLGGPF